MAVVSGMYVRGGHVCLGCAWQWGVHGGGGYL